MRESIFFASIRAFFLAVFAIAGLLVGLVIVLAVVAGISSTSDGGDPQIEYTYTPDIKPNALGIRKVLASDSPVILWLNVNGIIGLGDLTKEAIQLQLIESSERVLKDRVKAIFLYINSPGGTVVDAEGIFQAIKNYKEIHKVPVYAFVDGLCASGGMYIAVAADKIFATNVSLIGSVGVIMPTMLNFSELLDKWGIKTMTLYDGKGKDNLNPLRPWREGEEDNIKAAIDYYYAQFVDHVTANRPNLDKTKLVKDYGADIYPAPVAKEYGYIDEDNASVSQTLKLLAEQIKITDDYYQVVTLENKSWISQLFHSKFDLFSGRMTHQIELTPDTNPKLLQQYLYLYRP